MAIEAITACARGHALAGWWLAIDDTFPKLWERGITPMEELLIINADGRFEDRTMNFHSGSAEICAKVRVCADLPMIAFGRLRIAGPTLNIGQRGAPPNRLDSQKTDPMIRSAAFRATSPRTFIAESGLITLQSTTVKRTFARIEPQRLRRLRVGTMGSGLPAREHWRCFPGNAMARTPAFSVLRSEQNGLSSALSRSEQATQPPDFLDRYLRVLSYLMTLDLMIKYPLNDKPETWQFIGNEPEQLMVEEFSDVKSPVTIADTNRLKAQVSAIEARVRDKLKERAGGGPAPATTGHPAVSDAEISAFAQAASDDPAAKQLYCRD